MYPQFAQAQAVTGGVTGWVVASQRGQKVAGLRLTLVRFVLDANTGQPIGSAVQVTQTAADGTFAFKNIPTAKQAVWRVVVHGVASSAGQGLEQRTFRGPLFSLQGNTLQVKQTIHLSAVNAVALPRSGVGLDGERQGKKPGMGKAMRGGRENPPVNAFLQHNNQSAAAPQKPFVRESLLLLQPRVGGLQATWVMHIQSAQALALEQPLVFGIPQGLPPPKVLHVSAGNLKHAYVDNQLTFTGTLPAGLSIIALQLQDTSLLGSVRWALSHSLPVSLMSVLSPPNTVQTRAAGFALAPPRQLEGRLYNLIVQRDLKPHALQRVQVTAIPLPLWAGYVPLPLLMLLLGGGVYYLLCKRLSPS